MPYQEYFMLQHNLITWIVMSPTAAKFKFFTFFVMSQYLYKHLTPVWVEGKIQYYMK
jgi:hypothetical protein